MGKSWLLSRCGEWGDSSALAEPWVLGSGGQQWQEQNHGERVWVWVGLEAVDFHLEPDGEVFAEKL